MIRGILTINLDPPYVGFLPDPHIQPASSLPIHSWHHCTVDEIRNLLMDAEAISPEHSWPPRECILHLPIVLSKTTLAKHGLIHNLDVIATPKRTLIQRVS
ncbi:MAG: hypothetical protein K2X29_05320 [Candidatus Obscuribacterales bacterium]|nr:hypothetical protein [Candidatus Obscuribacterales bacterium]